MLNNKLLVNLYVLYLDKKIEMFVPAYEKVGNIVKLLDKAILGFIPSMRGHVLLNLYSGKIYNNNDVIKNTDIQNGARLILI